jgi:pSer/pThr/pTyr-binding forkhead associated (FHA) protein
MSQLREPKYAHEPVEHSGTLLETDDDVRQALLANVRPSAPKIEMRPAEAFRPTARPPLALLTVFDDGESDGEVIRMRAPRFIIGRTHGDLRIPFDNRISSRHVEITHQLVGESQRWVVTDLQSRHGLFVRVSRALLSDKSEILVGTGRYRFDAAPVSDPRATKHFAIQADSNDTHGISEGVGAFFRPPALTEILGRDIGNRVLLVKSEYWIGSDPDCSVCRADDLYCEPHHARIHSDDGGQWFADHNKARNGLWLRMTQVKVESSIQFQIGEQRFRLKIL